jgi:hypothetical protein
MVERRCVLPPRLTWEEDANHQDVLFSSVRNESLENCLYDVGVDDDADWAGSDSRWTQHWECFALNKAWKPIFV